MPVGELEQRGTQMIVPGDPSRPRRPGLVMTRDRQAEVVRDQLHNLWPAPGRVDLPGRPADLEGVPSENRGKAALAAHLGVREGRKVARLQLGDVLKNVIQQRG